MTTMFGKYDIRAFTTELTPDTAHLIGEAWAITQKPDTVAVGHDMRETSTAIAEALMDGAQKYGVNVINLGLASTDTVYFASGLWNIPTATVTASHNGPEYNGIKLTHAGAGGFTRQNGLQDIEDTMHILDDYTVKTSTGSRENRNILPDYVNHLHQLVNLDHTGPLKIVVDAGNGMAGHTTPAVFAKYDHIEIVPLYFDLDGTFPNHPADPLNPVNLVDLQHAVKKHKADLGLAFDGDADRVFVIDRHGEPVNPAQIAQTITDAIVTPGDHVVHNLLMSRDFTDYATKQGATLHRTPVGHSIIKTVMAKTNAVFGAEHSAHYYFRDFFGADSGMLAALHVIANLHNMHHPNRVQSGEHNHTVKDVQKTMQRIRDAYPLADTLDGITVETETFWWNVRPSNTEPVIRLNVEARTQLEMKTQLGKIRNLIV
jgi:phosphomannomutase